jgi:hypothetical protein
MMMVEYLADTTTRALGNFAGALGCADADVLTGDGCTLADIGGGVDWVKRDQVARTLSNALGRRSRAFGGSFADISGAPADLAARAAFLRLPLGGGMGCAGRLGWRLGLAVLGRGIVAADGQYGCEEHDSWLKEWSTHGLALLSVR